MLRILELKKEAGRKEGAKEAVVAVDRAFL